MIKNLLKTFTRGAGLVSLLFIVVSSCAGSKLAGGPQGGAAELVGGAFD